MTKELLQKELYNNGIKAKVLFVRKTDMDDYEVIFTRDLSSHSELDHNFAEGFITEPEEDVLVEDLVDAVAEIKYRLSQPAWYEEKNLDWSEEK